MSTFMWELATPAVDYLRSQLGPYYSYIRFVHLMSVMIWAWSTAVAYGWYLRQSQLRWQRKPDDPAARRQRDWAFEQFDRGAVMEHVAFPILIVTGLLLFIVGGWKLTPEFNWMNLKFALVIIVFVPMEAVDYYLTHFGGNKYKLRKSGDMERYERMIGYHWLFLRITTPIVIGLVPLAIFLAVVKPF